MSEEIPFGRIENGKIYKAAWRNNPERIIGEVKSEDEESSIQYFQNKYADLAQKVDALATKINNSENKGSYLMKLVHLQGLIIDHEGLGDYTKLADDLEGLESTLNEIIKKNRVRNSEIKKSLIVEIKTAVQEINWRESTESIHDIKSRWIKTGHALEEDQEELEATFWKEIEDFFERKRVFYEDKRRLQGKFKETYQALIKEAEGVSSLFGKAKYDKIGELKQQWKEVGNIAKEEYDPLLRTFNFKLKTRAKDENSEVKIPQIIKELELMTEGARRLDFKQLDQYKKTLKNFKTSDPGLRMLRKEALNQTQVLMEKDFVDKLARKRFNDFDKSDASKKNTIRIGVLRELLSRDKSDLETFEENSAKFNSRSGDTSDLIQRKLIQQKNKIEVKERLMKLLIKK
ncbi:MAG: DUF349 domain-containing protein [Cyclobacteriaceae bacterium]